ncbi:MAG: HU family DNA-binding protein [Pseudomonadota bacterium]
MNNLNCKDVLTKAKIAQLISYELGWSASEIEQHLDYCIEQLKVAVQNNDKVLWYNFGTFVKYEDTARPVQNIKSGQRIKLAARTRLKFMPARSVKERLNGKRD